jgi:hypothetical protein
MLHAIRDHKGAAMKPGDFELGSDKSRAAARMALQQRRQGIARVELWVGHYEARQPSAGPWTENQERMELNRMVSFPDGMTIVEVARSVGGYSQEELTVLAERFTKPLLGCELYRLDR